MTNELTSGEKAGEATAALKRSSSAAPDEQEEECKTKIHVTLKYKYRYTNGIDAALQVDTKNIMTSREDYLMLYYQVRQSISGALEDKIYEWTDFAFEHFDTRKGWKQDGDFETFVQLGNDALVELQDELGDDSYIVQLEPIRPIRVVKLMNDYTVEWPLWPGVGTDYEDVSEKALPISASLKQRVRAWAQNFNEHYHWDDGWKGGGSMLQRIHSSQANELVGLLNEELENDSASDWYVWLDYWEIDYRKKVRL